MRQDGNTSRTAYPLVRTHAYAAFAGLFLSALFGLMVSIKFHAPSFLDGNGFDTARCEAPKFKLLENLAIKQRDQTNAETKQIPKEDSDEPSHS
ncbi:MAG: hypothetical protein ACLGRW_13510 [Acidobacteriota bacterium]|jgi:hypothetical protein